MEPSLAVVSLAALAHGHRLGIFRMLVVRGPSGALAGEIAAEIGIGTTSASFHLKELDRAGLIHATRRGRNVRYALHIENVRRLLSFLTEDCCRGQPEFVGRLLQTPIAVLGDGCSNAGCSTSVVQTRPSPNPSKPARRKSKSAVRKSAVSKSAVTKSTGTQ